MAPNYSQEWLERRFGRLSPSDFEDGVRIYCTSDLVPPPNFRDVWTGFHGAQAAATWSHSAEEMAMVQAIIIISDPRQDAQVMALCRLIQAIDGLGHDAPPIVWVPHTTAPDSEEEQGQIDVTDPQMGSVVTQLLELGLDAMVPGEPEGFQLALVVRSKLHKLASLSKVLNDVVNERRSRAQYADYLHECIDCMLWDYLRIRLAPVIPPIDYDLAPGDIRAIDHFNFGPMLGRGMFGSVYRLLPQADQPPPPPGQIEEVVKVVSKAGIRDIPELKCMRRQIEVMLLLASDQWAHPNLVKLNHIYHSRTHMFFRMDFAGPENLFRRLHHRQKEGEGNRPLPLSRCHSLIVQAIVVVAHMHSGPHVCHRDLKPENFIVKDVPGSPLVLKLTDFDLAMIQEAGGMCRSPCGTVPFTAPEVFLQREYNGMGADVWSLGMVMLEVFCGIRVIEKALSLEQNAPGAAPKPSRPDDNIGNKVVNYFGRQGSAGALLRAKARPELMILLDAAVALLNGMLTVDTAKRFDSTKALAQVKAFPSTSSPAPSENS